MTAHLDLLLADLTSGDDSRAEKAALDLASLGVTALPALETLINSPENDSRWWAVCALAQMEKPPVDWLIQSLEDISSEVRQCAALGLCQHPAAEAIPSLVRLLADNDGMTATLAADALIAAGSPAVPPLLSSLAAAPQRARIEAIRALAGIGDMRAAPALMAAFEEDSLSIKYWAEEGLERLGLGIVYLRTE